MDFPNNRLTYTGVQGPIFDDESQNALNSLFTAVNTLLGLGPTDFAILSGFTYTPGTPGSYSGGIVYMSGILYYCAAGLNVGQYLIPNVTGIYNKPHQDGVSRNTYQVFYAVASNSSGAGGSPQFTTAMDSYRFDMKRIQTTLQTNIDNASGGYQIKKVDIGNWNMNSTTLLNVSLPTGFVSKVVGILDIMILDDSGNRSKSLQSMEPTGGDSGDVSGGMTQFSGDSIYLVRRNAGYFATSSVFSSVSVNRGYMTFLCTP